MKPRPLTANLSGHRMSHKTAIIIGAGPAGLTAAYDLLDKTDVRPIVFEAGDYFGVLSRTIEY